MDCVICGKTIERSQYSNAVLCSRGCFIAHFWLEIVQEEEEGRVIVDGEHYRIGAEHPQGYQGFRGFGGRLFKIEFFDGVVATTTNLWAQGTIPKAFRQLLPDNARFLKD